MATKDLVDVSQCSLDDEGNSRSEAAGSFPCPKNTFGNPFIACVVEKVGTASIAYVPEVAFRSITKWVGTEDGFELRVDEDGEIRGRREKQDAFDKWCTYVEKSNRRARREFLSYCVANRLTKMWTLTYAPPNRPTARTTVKRDVNEFFRKWRAQLTGGEAFPAAYVLERHKDGSLHVHIAVQDGFTSWLQMKRLWGHGRIQYDVAKGSERLSGRELSRCLARYLAKYLNKSFDESDRSKNERRYDTTHTGAVVKTRRRFASWKEAEEYLQGVAGETFRECWNSFDVIEWDGPPVKIFSSA